MKGSGKDRSRGDSLNRLDDLIEQSCDPEVILAQMRRDFGDGKGLGRSGHRSGKRKTERHMVSVNTMTDDVDFLVDKSVSKWIFGESHDVREAPAELGLSEVQSIECPENRNAQDWSMDDGSFRSDPILKVLRSRLRSLSGSW
jgi:hypothetical protein